MAIIPSFTLSKALLKYSERNSSLVQKSWFKGALLVFCVIVAMLLANLPATKVIYRDLLATNVQLHLFSDDGMFNLLFPRDMTIAGIINDILMVLFFFVVGLEIKREIAYGALSTRKKAVMPIIAALGGVLAPAIIYTIVNAGTSASTGWGIPTATDIAFAMGLLAMMGDKVPVSLKVFLTALAVTDDLIAILVVAIFYGEEINLALFGVSLIVIAVVLILRYFRIKAVAPYFICTILVWILFYYSGIHATMSGVVMAFLIPSTPRFNKSQYYHKRNKFIARLDELQDPAIPYFPNAAQRVCLKKLEAIAHGTLDMSTRAEKVLNPWVNLLIMPLFALANAGVEINDPSLLNVFSYDSTLGSVSLGVFLGLIIGKPLGITLFSWIAVKLGIGAMPEGADWKLLFAVACLGGIGFTMSIFIDTLSFHGLDPEITARMRDAGKIAVLLGSVCSAAISCLLVNIMAKKRKISEGTARQTQL